MCFRRVECVLILHSCAQRLTTLSLIGFIGPTKELGSIFKGICRQLETNQKVFATEDCRKSNTEIVSMFPPLSLCRQRNCISAKFPPRPV